jgi:hypothetical protein
MEQQIPAAVVVEAMVQLEVLQDRLQVMEQLEVLE